LDKVDFKLTLIKQDKEGYSILIKGEIDQKTLGAMSMHPISSNLKTYIDSNIVVVGDFNIPLSPIISHPNKKINKEILEPNHTIDQMDLSNIYRIFHPTSAQYAVF
jgi:hypothetical protein